MKNRLKIAFNEYKFLLILLSIFSVYLFTVFVVNGNNFSWYNDQQFQHNVFYKEWFRIIDESIANGRPSFYSWNTFLGTDFFTSKLLYCVGDFFITPLLFIFAIFNIDFDFNTLYVVETIVCIFLSGFLMQKYLKEFGIKNNYLRSCFAIIYSLSGFVVTYMGTYMFHRFYALLPLLFYFVEKYFKTGKLVGFSLTVAILFMQNYELMYSVSLFLVIYFLFSFKLKYDTSIFEGLKRSISLIFSYLVGLMLCGVALVPLIMFIKSNPRVGSMDYGSFFWDLKTVFGFLVNIICPSFNFRTNNPPYLFYTNQHFSSEYGVFASAIILIGIAMIFKKASKKEKAIFFTVYTLLLLLIFIRPLNMIVHGFSEPTLRWTFIFMFYNIVASSYVLDRYSVAKSEIIKDINIVVIGISLLLLLYIYYSDLDFVNSIPSIIVILVSLSTVYIYLFLFHKKEYKKIIICSFVNMAIFNVLMINDYKNYQYNIQSFNNEYLDYYITNDSTKLFRFYFSPYEIQPFNPINLNASMEYDYLSIQSYDSTYDNAVYDYLKWNGFDSWIIDISDFEMQKMLGVKYIGTLNNLDDNEELEYSFNLDDLKVYMIKGYNNIGHTYSSFSFEIPDENFDYMNTLYISGIYSDHVSNIIHQGKRQMEVVEYNRQYMKATIDVDSECILFVAIPYNNGWNIYNQNGDKLDYINVQGGFMGVIINEYDKELNFYYGTPGLKTGIIISALGIVIILFGIIYEKRNIL